VRRATCRPSRNHGTPSAGARGPGTRAHGRGTTGSAPGTRRSSGVPPPGARRAARRRRTGATRLAAARDGHRARRAAPNRRARFRSAPRTSRTRRGSARTEHAVLDVEVHDRPAAAPAKRRDGVALVVEPSPLIVQARARRRPGCDQHEHVEAAVRRRLPARTSSSARRLPSRRARRRTE